MFNLMIFRGVRSAILAGAVASFTSQASADTISNAQELFYLFNPNGIELSSEGVLRVTLNERRITDEIFYAAISAFCFWPLRDMEMPDVKSVLILNVHQAQGWLFDADAAYCNELTHVPVDRARTLIALKSFVQTDTVNGL